VDRQPLDPKGERTSIDGSGYKVGGGNGHEAGGGSGCKAGGGSGSDGNSVYEAGGWW